VSERQHHQEVVASKQQALAKCEVSLQKNGGDNCKAELKDFWRRYDRALSQHSEEHDKLQLQLETWRRQYSEAAIMLDLATREIDQTKLSLEAAQSEAEAQQKALTLLERRYVEVHENASRCLDEASTKNLTRALHLKLAKLESSHGTLRRRQVHCWWSLTHAQKYCNQSLTRERLRLQAATEGFIAFNHSLRESQENHTRTLHNLQTNITTLQTRLEHEQTAHQTSAEQLQQLHESQLEAELKLNQMRAQAQSCEGQLQSLQRDEAWQSLELKRLQGAVVHLESALNASESLQKTLRSDQFTQAETQRRLMAEKAELLGNLSRMDGQMLRERDLREAQLKSIKQALHESRVREEDLQRALEAAQQMKDTLELELWHRDLETKTQQRNNSLEASTLAQAQSETSEALNRAAQREEDLVGRLKALQQEGALQRRSMETLRVQMSEANLTAIRLREEINHTQLELASAHERLRSLEADLQAQRIREQSQQSRLLEATRNSSRLHAALQQAEKGFARETSRLATILEETEIQLHAAETAQQTVLEQRRALDAQVVVLQRNISAAHRQSNGTITSLTAKLSASELEILELQDMLSRARSEKEARSRAHHETLQQLENITAAHQQLTTRMKECRRCPTGTESHAHPKQEPGACQDLVTKVQGRVERGDADADALA
jgi:chromosome segregation ATPase